MSGFWQSEGTAAAALTEHLVGSIVAFFFIFYVSEVNDQEI